MITLVTLMQSLQSSRRFKLSPNEAECAGVNRPHVAHYKSFDRMQCPEISCLAAGVPLESINRQDRHVIVTIKATSIHRSSRRWILRQRASRHMSLTIMTLLQHAREPDRASSRNPTEFAQNAKSSDH